MRFHFGRIVFFVVCLFIYFIKALMGKYSHSEAKYLSCYGPYADQFGS